jgi:predicted nucleic acid-binding protein
VIFVDTGAWFAVFVPNDPDHVAATEWLGGNHEPLITSDYIFDELMTLFKVRGEFDRALVVGERIWQQQITQLVTVAKEDLETAWRTYSQYRDKEWSFTDCTSFALMQRLEIRKAFSFDRHFRQFGLGAVMP